MNYYKYTNGTAFFLNGEDYIGFFNIVNGIPYTNKYFSDESLELSFKNTFIADFFHNLMENDTTYQNLPSEVPYYSNVLDILDNQGLNELSSAINLNNLEVFKGFNIGNPIVYNFKQNNNLFYGVSSSSETLIGKQNYSHIESFSSLPYWKFLDSITTGSFFVDSQDNFKYFCSTGQVDYILEGSFNVPTTLSITYSKDLHPDYTNTPDYTYKIHNDYDNSKFFVVNNDYIRIYDSTNYSECENLPLLDEIALLKTTTVDYIFGKMGDRKFGTFHQTFGTKFCTDNPNNPLFIKFGNNVRTGLQGNILQIFNKYSSALYQSIDLSSYVGTILDLDISPSTDTIIVLHEINSELWILILYNLDYTTIVNTKLQSVILGLDWYKVRFSNIDSNQFHTFNQKEYQTRYLTNPAYPAGRLEQGELLYFHPYTFSQAKEKFRGIGIKFNSNEYPSNHFNITTVSEITRNNTMYMLLHNIGRIYALKQPIQNNIFSIIPTNLEQFFTGTTCSDSSLGLYVNSVLSNLIKDTMNLLVSSEGQFSISEYSSTINTLKDIQFDMGNMYINANETINVITLQRILSTVSNIQSKMLPI